MSENTYDMAEMIEALQATKPLPREQVIDAEMEKYLANRVKDLRQRLQDSGELN